MSQVLSLAYRPKQFRTMVGADKLIAKIRGHFANDREPQAWMFVGETGAGKTTIARIMAMALQCTHQKMFGNPCKECYARKSSLNIMELNGSAVNKIDEVKAAVSGANLRPNPGSRRRVYILDEMQRASGESQNFLLKYLEDCPASTVWIMCTTNPEKILPTIRSRCILYTVPSLSLEDTRILVERAFTWVGVDRDAEELSEALLEGGVKSPRLILMAVEKYLAGAPAEEAARVGVTTEVDISALNKAITKGHWRDAARWLRSCNKEDVPSIRGKLGAFLREILLNDDDFSDRNMVVAEAIKTLLKMDYMSDELRLAGIAAVAYQLANKFKLHSR